MYQNPLQAQYQGDLQGAKLSTEELQDIKQLACYFGSQLANSGLIPVPPKRKPTGPGQVQPGLPPFPYNNNSKESAFIGNLVAHAMYVAGSYDTKDQWGVISSYVRYNIQQLCGNWK